MKYFYGPVPSRRLGFSLGLDLVPKKTCSFDCIYCQVGRTTEKTLKRFSYIDIGALAKELKSILRTNPKIDYITLSGSGEPTLHMNLDKIIKTVKKITANKYPVAVITNSSLLHRKDVRKELLAADLIVPSLDAVSSGIFKKIKKPAKDVNLNKIITGLVKLRKEFKGRIWLEVMLLGGLNDTVEEALKLKAIIAKIKPDKVQINVPIRPSGYKLALPSKDNCEKIKQVLGLNSGIVSKFSKGSQRQFYLNLKTGIVDFLKRRPANFADLMSSLGVKKTILQKYLNKLINEGKIIEKNTKAGNYFVRRGFK